MKTSVLTGLVLSASFGAAIALVACSDATNTSKPGDTAKPKSSYRQAATPAQVDVASGQAPIAEAARSAAPKSGAATGLGKLRLSEDQTELRFDLGGDLIELSQADGTLVPVLRYDSTGDGEIDSLVRGRIDGAEGLIDYPALRDMPLARTRWQLGVRYFAGPNGDASLNGRYVSAVDSEHAQVIGELPMGAFEAPETETQPDVAAAQPEPEVEDKPGIGTRVVRAPGRAVRAVGSGLRKLWPF